MQFVSAPFRLLFAFLATLVPGLSTLLGLQPALPARSIAGLLDELCGPGKYPALIEGSHVEALQAARRQAKFLLIYLHEDNNESAREFCRRVLTDEALVAFVNVNMLFWAADTRTAIGSRGLSCVLPLCRSPRQSHPIPSHPISSSGPGAAGARLSLSRHGHLCRGEISPDIQERALVPACPSPVPPSPQ